jgi:hypothetical protein
MNRTKVVIPRGFEKGALKGEFPLRYRFMREYLFLINGGQTAQENMPESKKQEYYGRRDKFSDYLKRE